MHLWEQFPHYAQSVLKWPGLKCSKNLLVARELLELRDLLKCAAAANGNNTHGKETAQQDHINIWTA